MVQRVVRPGLNKQTAATSARAFPLIFMLFMYVIANIWGYIVANWRRIAIYVALVVVLVLMGLTVERCTRPKPPKLDEKQIREAQIAVEQHNNQKLKEILAESDTKVEEVDSNIKAIEEKRRQAARSYDGWTNDELAAELERRK
jgi:hypothetical protein